MKKGKITALILSAGKGSRMGTDIAKQYLMLNEKPVLYYSLKAFEESKVDEVILVVGKGQEEYCRKHIVRKYDFKKISLIIEGGKERSDSVYNGLHYIEGSEYVIIHDGARPMISQNTIENILEYLYSKGSCIVGVPVKDTIKMVDPDEYIKETPDRKYLWAAQTPQAFPLNEIMNAYEEMYKDEKLDKNSITDDASVYEKYMDKPVKIIKGEYSNIKITTIEDIKYAETMIK